jgi:iron complex outermembrane recepter protein
MSAGRHFTATLVLCLALRIVGTSAAEPQKVYDIDLRARSVAEALNDLSLQTGVSVVFPYDLVKNRKATAVVGHYTLLEAVNALLKGTGLSGGLSDKGVLTISPSTSSTQTTRETTVTKYDDPKKSNKNRATRPAGIAAFLASIAAAFSASANDTSTDQGEIEGVIITAQKRGEERLQDVPVPVSVISADALTNSDQTLLRDYYSSVPALNVSPNFAGQQMLSIRGVTTGGFTNPVVGILLDDVPFGTSTLSGNQVPDIDPGDLARVEVLRGPQGTLYGSNSMGGLLKFVTVDPSTDRYSGSLEAGTSTVYNGNGPGFNFRASANVPVSDTFAFRISGFDRLEPGYIDNPVFNFKGVNKIEAEGARLSTLWRPSADFSLKVSALYQKTKAYGSSDVDAQPGLGDLQQNYVSGDGGYDRRVQAYSAVMNAKFGGITLTSVTGYGLNHFAASLDFSSVFGSLVEKQYQVASVGYFDYDNISKFSQELRLAGSLWQNLDWLIGGFYTHENSPDREFFPAQIPATGQSVGLYWYLPYGSRFEEEAAFADLTYHFTDRFDVQVGGRESRDTNTQVESIQSGPFIGPTPSITPQIEAKTDAFTYLVTPRFAISPELMVYARVASGYRPGGPNPSPGGGVPPKYNSDKTQNYEVGLKGDFLDHKLFVDASIYYIDWKDIQIQRTEVVTFNTNGSRAKSEGVELSLTSRPLTGLTATAWVVYDDAVLTQAFPPGPAYGVAGDRLPNTSKWSANVSLEQEFPLGANATGFVGGTVSYVGDRLSVFTATADRQDFPAYTKTDLRAGVKWDSWTTNFYANNVADVRGLLNGGVGFDPHFAYVYIQPRTVGVNVVRKF